MAKKRHGPKPYRVKITRYEDAEGNRCKRDSPGARKVQTESDTYYADIWEGGKRTRHRLGTDDLSVAWERLRALQKRRHEEALGIRDNLTDAASVPLCQHLDDWIASVRASGITDKQVGTVRHSLDTLAALANWQRITDISSDSCAIALAALAKPSPRAKGGTKKGRSAQTRNHYLKHAKQFTRWAVASDRLRRDPLALLEPLDTTTDRRHDRRVPTDEEVAKLFEVLDRPDALVHEGMTGPQRALCYRIAMATGFRAGEMRSLTPASFDLEAGTVTVAASYSKRRREDAQTLPAWLVEQVRAYFAAGGVCWSAFPAVHPGSLLKLDLASAGIPYSVVGASGQPLFFDFHSLRHYFCTWAGNLPGISPRTLLALTRHSTVDLALKRYARARPEDIAATVQQLPQIGQTHRQIDKSSEGQ